jgi:hypothetical protein
LRGNHEQLTELTKSKYREEKNAAKKECSAIISRSIGDPLFFSTATIEFKFTTDRNGAVNDCIYPYANAVKTSSR